MSLARKILDIFLNITDNDAYANLALKDGLSGVENERDRRFASAVVYTTLEHLAHIDYIAAHYVTGKQKKPIRGILRLGICQILFMNRPDSAVCNESVKLSREIGKAALSGYINGVLRTVCRAKQQNELPKLPDDPVKRLAVITGYPLWIVKEYEERFGIGAAGEILTVRDIGVSVRAQFPYTTEELMCELSAQGIEFDRGLLDRDILRLKSGVDIADSELFYSGKITVQSESSAIVCRACAVETGMRVLDACAAPGGKSACIASLTRNGCDIISCDVHEHRTGLMGNTFKRLSVTCAETRTLDITVPHDEFCDGFDVVLCDVPCSGLGVVGKPDVRYRKDAEAVEAIAQIQREITDACAAYVKKGGKLVYSTCTVSYRENERIIESFLEKHKEFKLDTSLADDLPERLRERAEKGCLHLLPHTDGAEGFYIARFVRKR